MMIFFVYLLKALNFAVYAAFRECSPMRQHHLIHPPDLKTFELNVLVNFFIQAKSSNLRTDDHQIFYLSLFLPRTFRNLRQAQSHGPRVTHSYQKHHQPIREMISISIARFLTLLLRCGILAHLRSLKFLPRTLNILRANATPLTHALEDPALHPPQVQRRV